MHVHGTFLYASLAWDGIVVDGLVDASLMEKHLGMGVVGRKYQLM